MECEVCEEIAGSKNPVFSCDYCKRKYCKQCANLTSSEVKVLELKESRILKFRCQKCDKFETHNLLLDKIEDKDNIVKAKEEIISLLRQKIVELESRQSDCAVRLSYSDAAARTKRPQPEMNTNLPSILIKPKIQQNATKTEADIKRSIIPADLKVTIKNTRITKDGSFLIKCTNKNDIEILKKEAHNKLKEYDIQVTKLRWPRFKIVGFSDELDQHQITRSILEQNQIREDPNNLRITFIRKPKKNGGLSTIYGECSPNIFRRLMNLQKIYIGWKRYPVYEDLSIVRCFKCQQPHHKLDKCQNKVACEYCADEHKGEVCPRSLERCVNCTTANEKYKVNYNFHHAANDPECPSHKYLLNILRGKIDYGNGNGL